jgi:hypothetical protein
VQAGFRSAGVWEVDGEQLDLRQRFPQLAQAFGIRPVALPYGQGARIDPEQVAPLSKRITVKPGMDRDSHPFERLRNGRLLAAAEQLAHSEDDGPAVCDDHRVVDVNRVGVLRQQPGMIRDFDPGFSQNPDECIVFELGFGQIDRPGVMPAAGICGPEGLIRPPDEDGLKRGDHRLCTESA